MTKLPGAFIIRHKQCSIGSQKKSYSRNKVVSNQEKP